MTKREFLDTVFALVPKDANKIMDAFDEYVDSNEPHWIPFEKRQLTDEEKIDHPDWEYILDGEYPEDGQEVLITNGLWVTQDTFFCDGECYFDGGIDVEDVIAWCELPEPFKGVTE